MYRVLICLCVTVAICVTACSTKDTVEQVAAPLDTLTFPATEAVLGDADDVMGAPEDQSDAAARDLEAATE